MDVPSKWVSYHKKKILRRGSHFTKIENKIIKSVVFYAGKPLEMVPISENLEKILNQPFLDRERGFRPRVAHPVKKYFKYPPPPPELNSP